MGIRLLLLIPVVGMILVGSPGSVPRVQARPQPQIPSNPSLGFVWVNGAGYNIPDSRYQQAVEAGAAWTRWPLYWHEIETTPGRLDDEAYRLQDEVVQRDRAYGLQINALLLGTPGWASTAGSLAIPLPPIGTKSLPGFYGITSYQVSSAASIPANLYAPVFNPDGSINQNNYWGRFVYTTVSRYRDQIRVWELWNEPDLKTPFGQGVFWTGSREDYYQLLKVGYLAAKAADPTATILFAGLAYWTDPEFFPYVLDLMSRDSSAPGNNYYFDVLPWHFYTSSYHLYNYPLWSRELMQGHGFSKPIWVNEANIPVCNDTTVDPDLSCPSGWRGTMEEQASFIIQAVALARAAGVERVLGFQFYDDDVGPHEWYGFIRNSGSPRPAYTAYGVAARYLVNPSSVRRYLEGNVERVVLEGTPSGRVTVLWDRSPDAVLATVPAQASSARLITKYGGEQTIAPTDGLYRIPLAGATHTDFATGQYDLGGDPLLVIEEAPRISSRVDPLPTYVTTTSFPVSWSRLDNLGGAVTFDVQYREDEGPWQDWFTNTTATSATFGPLSPISVRQAHRYSFRSRARSASDVEPYPTGGCECDTTIGIAFPLTGQVTDNRGQPLFGVRISASGQVTGYSDSLGRYIVYLYPPGAYQFSAWKNGYGLVPARSLTLSGPISYTFALPPLTNVVQNWGFEGNGGVAEWWVPEGQVTTSTSFMHSGDKAAKLGESGFVGAANLYQDVTIPSGMTQPTLSFLYAVLGTPANGDRFSVTVTGSSGSFSREFSLGNTAWTLGWIALENLQGTVRMSFSFQQAGGSTARVFLDEVSIGPLQPNVIYRSFLPLANP